MTRAYWPLAMIGVLFSAECAWAVSGPSLGSPNAAATSQADIETLPAGQAERIESPIHDASPSQAADSPRYRWYQGRWWQFLADGRAVYWDGQAWNEVAPAPQAAFTNQPIGSITITRGAPSRRSPPPFRPLPRRPGESDGRYMGRLARWNSPYANGFIQFSAPPQSYFGYGYGYGMNPYSGYRPW